MWTRSVSTPRPQSRDQLANESPRARRQDAGHQPAPPMAGAAAGRAGRARVAWRSGFVSATSASAARPSTTTRLSVRRDNLHGRGGEAACPSSRTRPACLPSRTAPVAAGAARPRAARRQSRRARSCRDAASGPLRSRRNDASNWRSAPASHQLLRGESADALGRSRERTCVGAPSMLTLAGAPVASDVAVGLVHLGLDLDLGQVDTSWQRCGRVARCRQRR